MPSSATIYSLLGYPTATGFDSKHTFVRSWLLSPILDASLRLICIYIFASIIYSFTYFSDNLDVYQLRDITLPEITIVIGSAAIGRSFSYFTYSSFWGQGFYFFVSAVHTFRYAHRGTSWLHTKLPRWMQVLHSLYYTSVVCLPFLVTIVFWGTMYVGRWYDVKFDAWANLSIHAMNSVVAFVEIVLPATMPLPWAHLSVLLVILSLYLGLAYLTRATGGFFVYKWMNSQFGSGSIIAHIAGYTAGIVLIFCVVRGLVALRNRLVSRFTREAEAETDGKSLEENLVPHKKVASFASSESSLFRDVEAQVDRTVQITLPATVVPRTARI